MRSVIVSGITLAGALRRPAPALTAGAQTSREHAAARAPESLASRRARMPPRLHTALPARLLLPHWLAAPLLARRRCRPASLTQGETHFTPEAFPQLSPKACAVLNTPLKECDPKTLDLLVSTFTRYIGEIISPEAGITDLEAILPNLWHRLNAALADTKADTSLPTTPQPVPAVPADTGPDALVASPHPPAASTRPSAKDAPRHSPLPQSSPPAGAAIATPVIADLSTGRSAMLPGLMTDQEWEIIEPFLTTPSSHGGRPPRNHRRLLDGILWIRRTGAPWPDLPKEFGNWNSVWRQHRRWCLSGAWDAVLQALADNGRDLHALQMIDSTAIRPHRCVPGEKRRFGSRRLAALAAARLDSPVDQVCPPGLKSVGTVGS